jgi:CRP-like cAMP-binding protein
VRPRSLPLGVGSFFAYPTESPTVSRELVFLPDLDEEGWRRIMAHTERLRFAPGEIVINAGETDRSLYIVVDGVVEILLPTPQGELVPYGTIEQSITGEIAFLDGGPRTATIRAATSAELLRLSFESWEVLAARNPDLGRAILFDLARILAARLRTADEALVRRSR